MLSNYLFDALIENIERAIGLQQEGLEKTEQSRQETQKSVLDRTKKELQDSLNEITENLRNCEKIDEILSGITTLSPDELIGESESVLSQEVIGRLRQLMADERDETRREAERQLREDPQFAQLEKISELYSAGLEAWQDDLQEGRIEINFITRLCYKHFEKIYNKSLAFFNEFKRRNQRLGGDEELISGFMEKIETNLEIMGHILLEIGAYYPVDTSRATGQLKVSDPGAAEKERQRKTYRVFRRAHLSRGIFR